MAWNPESRAVGGEDVTTRYAPPEKEATQSGSFVSVRVRQSTGGERMALPVTVGDAFQNYGSQRTRAGRADMNDMPRFEVDPEALLTITVGKGQNARTASRRAAASGELLVDLVWDEMRSPKTKPSVSPNSWCDSARMLWPKSEPELKAEAFSQATTPSSTCVVTWPSPEVQRALWISMHGGGARQRVNDQQWRNQSSCTPSRRHLHRPRAPTDTWNLWHQGHIDDLFDRLIETFVATEGVDPNRVYLLGTPPAATGCTNWPPAWPIALPPRP